MHSRMVRAVLAGLLTWGALACAAPSPDTEGGADTEESASGATDGAVMSDEQQGMSPDSAIIAAQEALTPTVMALDGVTGTAVGLCDDQLCIKVYLARDDEDLRAQMPETFRGFKVDIEVTGGFEARDDAD